MASPKLNPRQQEAAGAPPGPLLIIAGAGTGKTRTLTSRLLRLLEEGVPGGSICALTFTNKAAKEMRDRISSSTNSKFVANRRIRKFVSDSLFADGPFIGTFHSLGARILRAESSALGRTKSFAIFDDHDSFDLMKKILKRAALRTKTGPSTFLGAISALKSSAVSRAAFARSGTLFDEQVLDVWNRYETELERQNAFDFDDLIQKTVFLFKQNPGVFARYADRFLHLLVDEYQDVNNIQYELIKILAGPTRNLTVVGDDQQTIYSWRGSNVEIFLGFERDWPGSRAVLLEENYRSSANIIEAASRIIAHNVRQQPKTLWTKNAAGEPVRIVEALDEREEAEWIAEEVRRSMFDLRTPNTEHPASTAILYRTNAQSRPLEEALIARGIPYVMYGGLKFYERREVKDILAALRATVNPQDEVSRERLRKFLSRAKFERLTLNLAPLRSEPPSVLIDAFLGATDYLEYMEHNLTNPEERRENVAELVRLAAEFSETPLFLERVSLLQATDRVDRNEKSEMRNEVSLMTVHLAKGLEFDRVFVAGVSEGLLPHARSLASEPELEEERRLLYVAMTRARRELSLSFYDLPSRFLSEIPAELTTFVGLVDGGAKREEDGEPVIRVD